MKIVALNTRRTACHAPATAAKTSRVHEVSTSCLKICWRTLRELEVCKELEVCNIFFLLVFGDVSSLDTGRCCVAWVYIELASLVRSMSGVIWVALGVFSYQHVQHVIMHAPGVGHSLGPSASLGNLAQDLTRNL